MRPIRSWPNSAWTGMPRTVMGSRSGGRPGSDARAPLPGPPSPLLLHQRAVALIDGPERLRGRDRRAQLVVVPRRLGLPRLLDLVEEHVVDLPAVGPDGPLAEQRVVGRHLLHLGDD